MNAVSQILRILAIVGALAAGAMYYLTQNKVHNLTSEMNTKVTGLTAQLKTANDATDAAKQQATKAEADAKATTDQLEAAKTELTAQAGMRTAMLHDLDDAQRVAKQQAAATTEKDAQIADLSKKAESLPALQAEIEKLTRQNKEIQAALENVTPSTVTPGSNKGGKQAVAVGPAAPATVTQVDLKSGLLVLDAGTDKGVQNNDNLVLQSNGVELGQLRVVDSHSAYAVTTIISTSGMSVSDFSKIVIKGLKVDYLIYR